MQIRTATAHPDGSLCLVLDEEPHHESLSVVIEFQPDRDPDWLRFEPGEQIDAVCAVPPDTARPGKFVVMTADGDVFDVVVGLPSAPIPGSGYGRADSLNIGQMTEIAPISERPTAVGFGGQVYVMGADGQFSALSDNFPVPEENPSDSVKFVSGAHSEKQGLYYFVGSIVTASPDSDAIEAANEAGDADLLVELMLAETRYDYGAVFTFDGAAWTQLSPPVNTEFDGVIADEGGTIYVREREGTLYQIPQPDEWNPVLVVDAPSGIAALVNYDGKVVVATDDGLTSFDGEASAPFQPELPETPGVFVEFGNSDDALFAFRSESVWMLDGTGWRRVETPVALTPRD